VSIIRSPSVTAHAASGCLVTCIGCVLQHCYVVTDVPACVCGCLDTILETEVHLVGFYSIYEWWCTEPWMWKQCRYLFTSSGHHRFLRNTTLRTDGYSYTHTHTHTHIYIQSGAQATRCLTCFFQHLVTSAPPVYIPARAERGCPIHFGGQRVTNITVSCFAGRTAKNQFN
jgi:hypothetical protein